MLGAFGPADASSLITLPAYMQNGAPTTLDTLGVAADWTVESGGTVSDAAGGGVTFTADSTSPVIARKVVAFNAASFDTQVTLDLKAGDANSEGRQVEFTAQHVTSGAGGIRWTFTTRTDLGWIRQPLNRSEASLAGATFSSDIVRLRVSAALGASGRSVTLRNLATRPIGKPAVLLTFDDQPANQWTAYTDVMRPRLARGTYFVNYGGASPVDSGAGRLTSAQLLTIVAEGGCVVNHSYTHTNHTGLTEAQIHTEIDDNETAMLAAGLPALGASTLYGTPFATGWDGATVKTAVLSRCEFNRTGLGDPDQVMPYVEPYIVTCRVMLSVPLSSLTAAVDNAVTRGTLVWFIWHGVADSGGDITPADLGALIDYCTDQRVPCITFEDWYYLNAGQTRQVRVPW